MTNQNNQSQDSNQNSKVTNIDSTLNQVSTLLNFEELSKDNAIESIRDNLDSVMKCIKGIKSGLAKLHIESNDINYAESMAEVLEYEEFYGELLEDIKKNRK